MKNSFFMKGKSRQKGFADAISLMGIAIMLLTLPAATKLVKENQETRKLASQVCPAVGQSCKEDYPEACTTTGGQPGTKICHKQGVCNEVGGGEKCSWGPGSDCDECVANEPFFPTATPPPTGGGQATCTGSSYSPGPCGGNYENSGYCTNGTTCMCKKIDGAWHVAESSCQEGYPTCCKESSIAIPTREPCIAVNCKDINIDYEDDTIYKRCSASGQCRYFWSQYYCTDTQEIDPQVYCVKKLENEPCVGKHNNTYVVIDTFCYNCYGGEVDNIPYPMDRCSNNYLCDGKPDYSLVANNDKCYQCYSNGIHNETQKVFCDNNYLCSGKPDKTLVQVKDRCYECYHQNIEDRRSFDCTNTDPLCRGQSNGTKVVNDKGECGTCKDDKFVAGGFEPKVCRGIVKCKETTGYQKFIVPEEGERAPCLVCKDGKFDSWQHKTFCLSATEQGYVSGNITINNPYDRKISSITVSATETRRQESKSTEVQANEGYFNIYGLTLGSEYLVTGYIEVSDYDVSGPEPTKRFGSKSKLVTSPASRVDLFIDLPSRVSITPTPILSPTPIPTIKLKKTLGDYCSNDNECDGYIPYKACDANGIVVCSSVNNKCVIRKCDIQECDPKGKRWEKGNIVHNCSLKLDSLSDEEFCCPALTPDGFPNCKTYCKSKNVSKPGTIPLGGVCNDSPECQGYNAKDTCSNGQVTCLALKCKKVFCDKNICEKPTSSDTELHACRIDLGYSGDYSTTPWCCPQNKNVDCLTMCSKNVPLGGRCISVENCEGYDPSQQDLNSYIRCENNTCIRIIRDVPECKSVYKENYVQHYCMAGLNPDPSSSKPNICCRGSNIDCPDKCPDMTQTSTSLPQINSTLQGIISGSIISNGTITLIDPSGKKYTAKTDKKGNFNIDVPTNKTYTVTIITPGYKPFTFVWDPADGRDYFSNIKLEKIKSEGVGSFTLEEKVEKQHLLAGWNLISLSVKPTKPLTASGLVDEINRQGGKIASVSRWIDSHWETYITGLDKNDFPIEVGTAYFVENENEADFGIQGEEITQPQTLDLIPGWNAVAFPKTVNCQTNACYAQLMLNLIDVVKLSTAKTISRFSSGLWEAAAKEGDKYFGNNFLIKPGVGYFLKITQPIRLLP